MWNLPGPGIKPVSPALADGFLSTVPSGKFQTRYFCLGHMKESLYKSHGFASRYVWKSSYRRLTSQCKCVDCWNHVSSTLSLPINKLNGSSWAWVVSLMVHPSQSFVFLQRIFNIPLRPQIPWITRKWSRLLIRLYPQAIQLPPFPFAHFHCRY